MEDFGVSDLKIFALRWLFWIRKRFGVEETGFRIKNLGFVCLNVRFQMIWEGVEVQDSIFQVQDLWLEV